MKNINVPLFTVVVVIGLSLIVGSGYLLWQEIQGNGNENQSTEITPDAPPADEQEQQSTMTQEEAIRQAEQYQPGPDKMCTMVLVDAVHAETGAEYTFPSGCLAPGWEPR